MNIGNGKFLTRDPVGLKNQIRSPNFDSNFDSNFPEMKNFLPVASSKIVLSPLHTLSDRFVTFNFQVTPSLKLQSDEQNKKVVNESNSAK